MGLGITHEGGGFQKLVFENVVDTLPGGVVIDIAGYTAPEDGYIPEGTLIGKDPATGLGKIVAITPADGETPASFDPAPIGMLYRSVKAEENALGGVVISGTARIKALPDDEQASADAI